MEHRLADRAWLVADRPTIADLALFAYTHRADEGGFDLARWPSISGWVSRMGSVPGIAELRRPPYWTGEARLAV